MVQRGVKSKYYGRLPRPLKGQSCKKNHIWGTFTILVLWERCINTLPMFLLPLHDAAGSQTPNSNNSTKLKQKKKRFYGVNRGPRWVLLMGKTVGQKSGAAVSLRRSYSSRKVISTQLQIICKSVIPLPELRPGIRFVNNFGRFHLKLGP